MIVEVCAPNFEIAKAAAKAGANRLEICQGLEVGGLTPSYSFIEKACVLNIPVRVLIRPRSGHFYYTVDEMEMMLKDIEVCQNLGAEGVVLGALNESNGIDMEVNRIFRECSDTLKFIFHRGIDLTGTAGFMAIKQLNFDGALCSGNITGLDSGLDQIKEYVNLDLHDFEIVAGGGLNENNLPQLLDIGIDHIHFSCQKKRLTSRTAYNFKNSFDKEKWERINRLLK